MQPLLPDEMASAARSGPRCSLETPDLTKQLLRSAADFLTMPKVSFHGRRELSTRLQLQEKVKTTQPLVTDARRVSGRGRMAPSSLNCELQVLNQ